MGQKVVVTGGLGFVGSNLVTGLAAAGHDVVILDAPGTPVRPELSGFRVERADITDASSLAAVKLKADAVLHCAAQSSGPASMKDPVKDVRINQIGTLQILDWCRANEIPRILFASSFVVYGDNPSIESFREDSALMPKSYYAVSKMAAERLIQI